MLKAVSAGILSMVASMPVLAQDERPCRNDIMTYCSQHVGDQEGLRTCVRDNAAKFSEACRARLQSQMQQRQRQGNAAPESATPQSKPQEDGGS